MDEDRSDVVGMTEVYDWMNNRVGKRTMARELRLCAHDQPGEGDGEAGAPSRQALLEDRQWSPVEIRHEIQRTLIAAGLAPLDLIRAWDSRGSNVCHATARAHDRPHSRC